MLMPGAGAKHNFYQHISITSIVDCEQVECIHQCLGLWDLGLALK